MEVSPTKSDGHQKVIRTWTLEPALFLLFFGWYLSNTIVVNQILKQTCLFTFEYNYVICTQLDDKNVTGSVEEEIQPYVANILMTISVFNSIIPTILSLFLGPWSDTYGRKKVINSIFIGFTISMGWITIISYLSDFIVPINPWNYLFAQLPFMTFGGYATLITLILCYITDQTSEENRSFRFTIFEIIIFIGVLLAIASSSFILEVTNPTTIFTISFLCIFSATMIELFFVKETVQEVKKADLSVQLTELFTIDKLKGLLNAWSQKRPFKHRQVLWLLTLILMMTNFTSHGSNTVFYLFARQKFGWTLQDLTIYESATMLMTVFGSIIGLILLKNLFGMSDISLSILSLASLTIDALIKAFANHTWQLYLASLISLFKIISGPMLRSIMSTMVSKSEVSKIYAITTSIEAISGLGAAPLYTATYSATLTTFPAAFNLITAGVFGLAVLLAGFVAFWMLPVNKKTVDTRL